jgi:hypothetical protein
MKVVHSSEMLVNICQTAWHYTTEERHLHTRRENPKSHQGYDKFASKSDHAMNVYKVQGGASDIVRFQVLMAMVMKITDCLLGCCAVKSGRYLLTLQKCLLLPSSGQLVSMYQTTQHNVPKDSHLHPQILFEQEAGCVPNLIWMWW